MLAMIIQTPAILSELYFVPRIWYQNRKLIGSLYVRSGDVIKSHVRFHDTDARNR